MRGDYAYVSEFYNLIAEEGLRAGDYSQVNLSAGITIDSRILLEISGQNLTDNKGLTHGAGGPENRAYQLRPRTIGMRATYRF